MRRISNAAGKPMRRYAPKTDVWTRPDCVLLRLRMFWKCLFRTSSMAWQNPQMKNREATMMNANSNGLRLDLINASVGLSVVLIFVSLGESRFTASYRGTGVEGFGQKR
jgi:hypothetical protein